MAGVVTVLDHPVNWSIENRHDGQAPVTVIVFRPHAIGEIETGRYVNASSFSSNRRDLKLAYIRAIKTGVEQQVNCVQKIK